MEEFVKLAATTGIGEVIKLAVDTYIKPKLKLLKFKNQFVLEKKFSEYMERSYNSNLYMNTIVFKNSQKTINDLYIPLTVSRCLTNANKKVEICIDKYGDDFIPHYKKVLLVDNAGMGKSTILKFLYLSAITNNKGIPILIELRKLSKNTSIIDFIVNELNGIKQYFSKEEVLDLIEEGGFIFFFDGYDEITDENKQKVTDNLQDFISKTSITKDLYNNFVISSRDENSLNCFSDFQRFEIKALTKKEAYKLIRKYDNNGELSEELINNLNNQENLRIIDEFLVNPLMASLLYIAFEYKRVIPYKKQIFYRQVYDALFQDHDETKGGAYVHPKKSKLDLEDFHRVLRILGFITLNKGISYCEEELVQNVNKAKEMAVGVEFKASDFICDIIHSVPIFVKEGIEYRWVHKSFQEYFAASYVCYDSKENQGIYLSTMIQKGKALKYYNVLDFCYDMDYKEFRKDIIYPIIKKFIQYYNNSYKDKKYINYDFRSLDIRKNLNFIYDEIYIKFFNIGEVNNKIDTIRHINDKDNPVSSFQIVFENWEKIGYKGKMCGISEYHKDIGVGVGFFTKNEDLDMIIDLLTSKKSSLVKVFTYSNNNYKKHKFVQKNINKEWILNAQNEDVLNNKDDFTILNDILMDFRHSKRRVQLNIFDYEECVKLKEKIEKQIEAEKDDILFL